MPESSIIIFADGTIQNRYRDLGVDKESLNIFSFGDARAIMDRLKANIILIDCGIRDKKGLRLLKEIKARHPQIPVIYLTDSRSEELAIAAFHAGAREYFVSPVNRLVLKKTILGLMKIREKTSEMRLPFRHVPVRDHKLTLGFDGRDVPLPLREVLLYIEENFTNKITLSSLAQQWRMSKFHFSHYFRKHIGQSPIKYVNTVRIQHAQELLSRDDLTVSEISGQLGYDDLGAFSRHFKKITGLTPTEFRRRSG